MAERPAIAGTPSAMAFIQFTRADNAPVVINTREIVTCAPVPADSRLEQGTRITFRNGGLQDVKELVDEVRRTLSAGTEA
jgi:hypothetical protein